MATKHCLADSDSSPASLKGSRHWAQGLGGAGRQGCRGGGSAARLPHLVPRVEVHRILVSLGAGKVIATNGTKASLDAIVGFVLRQLRGVCQIPGCRQRCGGGRQWTPGVATTEHL